MDSDTISKIDQQVFRQFPFLSGTIPDVSQENENRWLLLYKGSAVTADGHEMPVVVRVLADNDGRVIKLTSSR
jgi:hypothetical protein